MIKLTSPSVLASVLLLATALSPAHANSGPAIVAKSVTSLTVDGDLSDWPDSVERQQLWHFDFEVSEKPEADDASGSVLVGFDRHERALYVAMEIKDDVFITERMASRLPNGLGTNPDGVLLYFDVEHRSTFAENMEFSFVSRPIAAADNELLPDGIVSQARLIADGKMTAEWRIDLPALFAHQGLDPERGDGRDLVMGFDAVYFDRDADEDGSIIKWTVGPNDGEENRRLGDLFILEDDRDLVRVNGFTSWGDAKIRPPYFAHFVSQQDSNFVVRGTTHPDGEFHVKIPAVRYRALATDSRSVQKDAKVQNIRIRQEPKVLKRPLLGKLPEPDLVNLVPAMMAEHNVRTVGIAWLKNGEIRHNHTFGVEDDGDAATLSTRFRVASITKPISTMTILSLVEEGLWDLDTPLATHWVDPDLVDDLRHQELTTRMALRHLTGLPNWRGRAGLQFLYEPGSLQSYSGEGFEYARRALEAATGKDLEAHAQTRVFSKANMPSTSYRWSEGQADTFAGEYFGTGAQVPHYRGDGINAAANLLSTPTDLINFAAWVMEERKRQPALFEAIETPNPDSVIDPEKPELARHGLGWIIHRDDGVTVLEHSGGQRGIRTHLIVVPERNEALVVLTNSSAGWPIVRSVFNATLNQDGSLQNIGDKLYGDVEF
ncbi:MAG: serine hydrolase [Parvularculaceae bacterium]|nr:serine hydrolase [Parvularculaceae bacterium]